MKNEKNGNKGGGGFAFVLLGLFLAIVLYYLVTFITAWI